MQLSFTTPIWLYPMPIDFRKQLDGIVILVADALSKDPCSGELFIFAIEEPIRFALFGMTVMDFGCAISD